MDPHRNPIGTSRTAPFVVRFGISANNGAERTARELRRTSLGPFLGPRSSISERPEHCRAFGSSSSERLLCGVNVC
eukprot:10871823-Alexandrium_andersonii.AAC.1